MNIPIYKQFPPLKCTVYPKTPPLKCILHPKTLPLNVNQANSPI